MPPRRARAPALPRETETNKATWTASADAYQKEHAKTLAGDVLWGPSMPPESELEILGSLRGKDVLEIACGGAQCVIHAKKSLGARRAAGVDISPGQLAHARRNAKRANVEVELVESSAEDLSHFADASFDVAFSAYAFGFVADVDRAFAEAFRALRPGGLFAFSWASRFHEICDLTPDGSLLVWGSYWAREPFSWSDEHGVTWEFPRTYGAWHRALTRAGFVVEEIVEPAPLPQQSTYAESHPLAKIERVPGTVIWKARKPGAVTSARTGTRTARARRRS